MERALKAVERMESVGDTDATLELEREIARILNVSWEWDETEPTERELYQEPCRA